MSYLIDSLKMLWMNIKLISQAITLSPVNEPSQEIWTQIQVIFKGNIEGSLNVMEPIVTTGSRLVILKEIMEN